MKILHLQIPILLIRTLYPEVAVTTSFYIKLSDSNFDRNAERFATLTTSTLIVFRIEFSKSLASVNAAETALKIQALK